MDVFGVCTKRIDPRGIGFRPLGNFVECGERLLHFGGREDADGLERFRPGAVDGDLVRQKATIERKGSLERVEVSVWLALEASSPEAVIFPFGHRSVSKGAEEIGR